MTVDVDLGELGFDRGGHLLVKRALHGVPVGRRVVVRGDDPHLPIHLRAWCRAQGHRFHLGPPPTVERGDAHEGRWRGAERAGHVDPARPDAVAEHPPARWGLAARGASILAWDVLRQYLPRE